MISIAASMDEHDIAQEIRIERQVHKGSFLLLEGETDLLRFSKFVDQQRCSTVNCFGRKNLIGAIELLYEDGFLGALGLADADFDRVLDELNEHEGVIYSEGHDFDLDCACETALQRYLDEVGDANKCEANGHAAGVRKIVIEASKPLSVLRLTNHSNDLRYNLKNVRHDDIYANDELAINLMIDHVSTGRFNTAEYKRKLEQLIAARMRQTYDLNQLTNGHDFFAMLGLLLRERLSDRLKPQSWGKEVAIHFRLAYSDDDFAQSEVCKAILVWEAQNKPYIILRDRFRIIPAPPKIVPSASH